MVKDRGILIGWLIKLSVQTFHPLIVFYRRGIFVYENWECLLIYWPLSYPFRSLLNGIVIYRIV